MSALFASGLVVELILGLVAIEAFALLALRRLTGLGPAAVDVLPNLAAGACLLLAVHAAICDRPWVWVAAPLAAALFAHLLDLSRRWPRAHEEGNCSIRGLPGVRGSRERDYDSV